MKRNTEDSDIGKDLLKRILIVQELITRTDQWDSCNPKASHRACKTAQ